MQAISFNMRIRHAHAHALFSASFMAFGLVSRASSQRCVVISVFVASCLVHTTLPCFSPSTSIIRPWIWFPKSSLVLASIKTLGEGVERTGWRNMAVISVDTDWDRPGAFSSIVLSLPTEERHLAFDLGNINAPKPFSNCQSCTSTSNTDTQDALQLGQ